MEKGCKVERSRVGGKWEGATDLKVDDSDRRVRRCGHWIKIENKNENKDYRSIP